jgi:hypothetical protein
MTRLITLLLVTGALALQAGCGAEVACGDPPDQPIQGFYVTTVTGDEPTDMNIHFCYSRKSGGGTFTCMNLDTPGNNFERGQTDHFEVPAVPPVGVGDLDTFQIKNTGGGFFELSWDIRSLIVEAILEDGSRALLAEVIWDDDLNLSKGETYTQSECAY